MTPERLRDLKFQVRRHMNGDVAQIMKSLDDSYKANYGISLQHARDVAAQEHLSEDECYDLWLSEWRDLMLIGAAGVAAHNPTAETISRYAESVATLEMADALPFLVVKADNVDAAVTAATMIAGRAKGYDLAVALNLLARALVVLSRSEFRKASAPDVTTDDYISWSGKIRGVANDAQSVLSGMVAKSEWTYAEAKAISFLARQLCRLSLYGGDFADKQAIESLRKESESRSDEASKSVAMDVAAEMEMVNSLC